MTQLLNNMNCRATIHQIRSCENHQFLFGSGLSGLGIGIWMIFAFIKIPKPGKKLWQLEAVIRILFAMGGGVVLTTIGLVASLEIGETITKFGNLIIGMMAAGTILGTFLGAITGVLLVKLSTQRTFFSAKPAQHRLAR
jgi:MFS family permease